MPNDQNPLVSVIITAFNREKYIVEAIDSVLTQDYSPIEVIVVDDGSTDRTAEIVKSYGDQLVYVHQENQGVATARNNGINLATGEFLAFNDSDDVWADGKLSLQMSVLFENPNLHAVYGHAEQFFSPDVDEAFIAKTKIPKKVMPSQISCALVIRRTPFDKVGFFAASLLAGSDIDWYARFQEAELENITLPDIVYYRRVHPQNSTSTIKDSNKMRLRALKVALDRRRSASV